MFKHIREDIDCILAKDPAARSRLEIVTCYPGFHAILAHRLAHRLWRNGWHWLARFTSHLARMLTGVEIHPGARVGRRVFIDHGHGVVIGETAVIGDDCTIYQGVTLGGTRLYKGQKRHPTLGKGVVVGAGAQILGGFEIGDGARIGSNAVVVKPVPAGATAVGNPARVVIPESGSFTTVAPPRAGVTDCCDEGRLDTQPLQDILATQSISPTLHPPRDQSAGFSAYAVDAGDTDPLVKVLHELIDHTARQDARIAELCRAVESLGKQVEPPGATALDTERLNRLVD